MKMMLKDVRNNLSNTMGIPEQTGIMCTLSKSFEPKLGRPYFCWISSLQDTHVPRFCHKT